MIVATPGVPGQECLNCRECGSCDYGLPMNCTCGSCSCLAPCGHPNCAMNQQGSQRDGDPMSLEGQPMP